jgi:hypothetical protein
MAVHFVFYEAFTGRAQELVIFAHLIAMLTLIFCA